MNPASPRATRAHIFGILLLALLCVLAIARSAAGTRLDSLGRVTVDELERIRARMPTPKFFG